MLSVPLAWFVLCCKNIVFCFHLFPVLLILYRIVGTWITRWDTVDKMGHCGQVPTHQRAQPQSHTYSYTTDDLEMSITTRVFGLREKYEKNQRKPSKLRNKAEAEIKPPNLEVQDKLASNCVTN